MRPLALATLLACVACGESNLTPVPIETGSAQTAIIAHGTALTAYDVLTTPSLAVAANDNADPLWISLFEQSVQTLGVAEGPLVSTSEPCPRLGLPTPTRVLAVDPITGEQTEASAPKALSDFRSSSSQHLTSKKITHEIEAGAHAIPMVRANATVFIPGGDDFHVFDLSDPEAAPTRWTPPPASGYSPGTLSAYHSSPSGLEFIGNASGNVLCGTFESGFVQLAPDTNRRVRQIESAPQSPHAIDVYFTLEADCDRGRANRECASQGPEGQLHRMVADTADCAAIEVQARFTEDREVVSANQAQLVPLIVEGGVLAIIDAGEAAIYDRGDDGIDRIRRSSGTRADSSAYVPGVGAVINGNQDFRQVSTRFDPESKGWDWSVTVEGWNLEGFQHTVATPDGSLLYTGTDGHLGEAPLRAWTPAGGVIDGCYEAAGVPFGNINGAVFADGWLIATWGAYEAQNPRTTSVLFVRAID